MNTVDYGLLNEMFSGMRQFLTPEFRDWSPERFIKLSGKNSVPDSFGFGANLDPNLGVVYERDIQGLWAVFQLMARALVSGKGFEPRYKTTPWEVHVEHVPWVWLRDMTEVLSKRTSAFSLALYPEPTSRLMASVLVSNCGFSQDWDYSVEESRHWRSLAKSLMDDLPEHLWHILPPSEVLEIKNAVVRRGFEKSQAHGLVTGNFGYSAPSELFRLAYSLARRVWVPRCLDDPDRNSLREFWFKYMNERFPCQMIAMLDLDVSDMPLQMASSNSPLFCWMAQEKLSA
jgi:hypothetical protein